MHDPLWHQPRSVADALGLLSQPGAVPLAGGVELMLAHAGGANPAPSYVALTAIPNLGHFLAHPKIGLEIGATVRLRSVESDVWVAKRWAALHEAVEQIALPQIHNMGTVIGNLCAGNVLYDLQVALAAHRAELVIASPEGERRVAITEFYDEQGKARLRPGELVLRLLAPRPSPDAGSAFRKISRRPRADGEPAKLGVAAYVALDTASDTIKEVALAVGIGAPPQRLAAVEKALLGRSAATASYEEAAAEAAALCRGRSGQWFDAVQHSWVAVLVRDVLEQAASRARSRHDPFDDAATMIEAGQ